MPTTQTKSLSVTVLLPGPNLKHFTYILFYFYTIILQTHWTSSHWSYPLFSIKVSRIHPHSLPCSLTPILSPSLSLIAIFTLSLLSSLQHYSSFYLFQPDDHTSYSLEKIGIPVSKCPYSFTTKSLNLSASQCLYSTFPAV